jgi:hypothetical protein
VMSGGAGKDARWEKDQSQVGHKEPEGQAEGELVAQVVLKALEGSLWQPGEEGREGGTR